LTGFAAVGPQRYLHSSQSAIYLPDATFIALVASGDVSKSRLTKVDPLTSEDVTTHEVEVCGVERGVHWSLLRAIPALGCLLAWIDREVAVMPVKLFP
jgi:hypothetical protein